MRISVATAAGLLLATACQSDDRQLRELAPLILQQYGYQDYRLGREAGAAHVMCPRGYFGITGMATHSGTRFEIAVCWLGPPDHQTIAVVRRRVSPAR